jgi:oxygen-independent coproporphyrinogen-3 oxidase
MLGRASWNDSLMQRYGQTRQATCWYPGPGDLRDRLSPLDLFRALRDSRRAQRPLALSIEVDDLAGVVQQTRQIACHLGPRQPVVQLRLRPGRLGIGALPELLAHLRDCFHFSEHAVCLAEVELAHADWPLVGMLRSLGFSQLSVGVPDMHAGDGGSVEYFRSAARIRGLLEAARALQFEAINVDLGYGRSWQTGTSFARKLASIIELQPDRVSLFDYRSLSIAGRLPSPRLGLASRSAARDMHRHGVEQLTAAGYRLLGLGCFVLPHDELALAQENESLRHDVAGYSTTPEGTDHLSLGVGAISRLGDCYVQCLQQPARYREALQQDLLPVWRGLHAAHVDGLRRAICQGLICQGRLDLQALDARFGAQAQRWFAATWPLLRQLQREAVLELSSHGLMLAPEHQLLLPGLCEALVQPLIPGLAAQPKPDQPRRCGTHR